MQPRCVSRALFVALIVAGTASAAEPLVVEIWPGKVPDESGEIGAERVRMSPKLDRKQVEVTEQTRLITNVTKPTITIYRPARDKDTGTAMRFVRAADTGISTGNWKARKSRHG